MADGYTKFPISGSTGSTRLTTSQRTLWPSSTNGNGYTSTIAGRTLFPASGLPLPPGSPLVRYSSSNVDGLGNVGFVNNQQVGTWVNIGSLGAAWNNVQAVGGTRPTWLAVGSAGKMNNLPAVNWNGSQNMASATSLPLQAQPLTWVVVASANGVGNESYFGGVAPNGNAMLLATLAISIFAGSLPATGQSITASKIQTLTATMNGAASFGSVDGVSGGAVAAGANSLDNIILGANGAFLNNVTGIYYEVLVYGAGAPSVAAINAWVTLAFGATPQ